MTSEPSSTVPLARTPFVNGRILATEEGCPERTKMSCAAIAAAGAPKTGPIESKDWCAVRWYQRRIQPSWKGLPVQFLS